MINVPADGQKSWENAENQWCLTKNMLWISLGKCIIFLRATQEATHENLIRSKTYQTLVSDHTPPIYRIFPDFRLSIALLQSRALPDCVHSHLQED